MYRVGKIDKEIYKCITTDRDGVTEEVVITDKQIKHIKERHLYDYKKVMPYISETLEEPDYIISNKHKDTGLVIKSIMNKKKYLLIVLKICSSKKRTGYKNSIISFWTINERRLQNYLKNREILYKRE